VLKSWGVPLDGLHGAPPLRTPGCRQTIVALLLLANWFWLSQLGINLFIEDAHCLLIFCGGLSIFLSSMVFFFFFLYHEEPALYLQTFFSLIFSSFQVDYKVRSLFLVTGSLDVGSHGPVFLEFFSLFADTNLPVESDVLPFLTKSVPFLSSFPFLFFQKSLPGFFLIFPVLVALGLHHSDIVPILSHPPNRISDLPVS